VARIAILIVQNHRVAHVALFHSVLGLRPVELRAADLLRSAGHAVVTPDLYAGETASTIHDGFRLVNRTGWAVMRQRARRAMNDLPDDAVLAGFSMGAGVVDSLLPARPEAAGVLLLHGLAGIPATVRSGLPVQVHVADPDEFARPAKVAEFRRCAVESGVDATVFTYEGIGHFYTDADGPDYDERAATLTWQRALDFLDKLGEPT